MQTWNYYVQTFENIPPIQKLRRYRRYRDCNFQLNLTANVINDFLVNGGEYQSKSPYSVPVSPCPIYDWVGISNSKQTGRMMAVNINKYHPWLLVQTRSPFKVDSVFRRLVTEVERKREIEYAAEPCNSEAKLRLGLELYTACETVRR